MLSKNFKAIFLVALFVLFASCKRNGNSEVTEAPAIVAGKKFFLTWSCFGKGKIDHVHDGVSFQDEYCEWTRVTAVPNKKLECTFWAAFNSDRKFYLTMRHSDPSYIDTKFNSYTFLLGGFDKEANKKRTGIIPHCLQRQCGQPDINDPTYVGNCVPNVRSSDPTVCMAINAIVENCTLLPEVPVPAGPLQERLRISVPPQLRSECKFIVDPNLPPQSKPDETLVACSIENADGNRFRSCDDVARQLAVGVDFEVQKCR